MASGPELPTIRVVGSNQPTVVRCQSQQSAAASDDYYSLPDSDGSSRSRPTVVPYRTPPSRNISPSLKDAGEHNQPLSSSQGPPTSMEQPLPRNIAGGRNATQSPPANDRPRDSYSGADDTPYVRFAIEQLTRDEELMGTGRNGSVASTEYSVERLVLQERQGEDSAAPMTEDHMKEKEGHSPSPRHSTGKSPRPKRRPISKVVGDANIVVVKRTVVSDVLVPADSVHDLHDRPPLDYIPVSLRPTSLIALITLCLAMMAALAFCQVWSQRHAGLWDYDVFGGRRYFVFQYLPQMLAALIVLWTFVVQAAVYRITPLYILGRLRHNKGVLENLPMLSRNFVLPDTSHFRHGERTIGTSLLVVWLTNVFAIPLQSSLFQVRFYASVGNGGFRWTVVQAVVWTLLSLYGLLAVAIFALMARFSRRTTGLLSDPESIADIIPLIRHLNIRPEFGRSEVAFHVGRHVSLGSLRLGYWWDSSRTRVVYGIGKEGRPLNRNSVAESQDSMERAQPDIDVEQQCLNAKGSFEKALHSPFSRSRWAPWFLRDTFIVAWIAIGSVLTIAFVVATFVNQPILKGFLPLLPTLPSDSSFSASNFLFSFVPSFIGTVVFLAWQHIDVYFRSIQAYADLSSHDGAPAETSLLLRYNSRLPLEVTYSALAARHYKVAYVSFIGVASVAIPILAGGVFLARFYADSDEIRMSTHLPAYYTLMGFVILYALSLFIIWPRRKRYLPHSLTTYGDVVSFLYQSPLLADDAFCDRENKAERVKGDFVAPSRAEADARYAFGIYRGLDGQEHLGIDRLE